VPVSRVLKVSLTIATAALALSGCMQRRGPVAYAPVPARYAPPPVVAQPIAPARSDLDAMAYGTGPVPYPQAVAAPVAVTSEGAAVAPPVPAAPPPVIAASPPPPAVLPPPRPGASYKPGLLSNVFRKKPGVVVAASAPVVPVAVAAPVILHDPAYRLDAGDRLRIVVYGQEGLTNAYSVDAAGVVTMPLIGSVPARGGTPAELAAAITSRLQNGFIREPYVAVEIEAYRPFFILGEVTAPGQYPYVPNMTAEAAVAIAGGFTPRAKRNVVFITRTNQMGQTKIVASPNAPLSPGDTVTIGERWF
jgi:polysaccharide biosynthesis/export protein